jgi:alpha-N-acetylglucosamine transferase
MKFLTVEINHVKNQMYERLLNAWENSVITNTNAEYERAYVDSKDYPFIQHPKNSYVANSVKLNYWGDKIKNENGNICLIDGDTVVLKDVEHVFDKNFDIAFTQRSPGIHIPINGGVLFIKATERVHDFFDKWVMTNNEMLTNPILHKAYYRKYNGINQASFGYMLERYKSDLKIISLPCAKYNACDVVDWKRIDSETHILHAKSQLRLACLQNIVPKGYENAVKAWKQYESISTRSKTDIVF